MAVVREALPKVEPDWETECGLCCASDMKASNCKPFCGVGFANHCPFFDPTDVEECPREQKLWAVFSIRVKDIEKHLQGATVADIARQLSMRILVHNDLSKVSETMASEGNIGKGRSVHDHHLHTIGDIPIFKDILRTPTRSTLTDLECSVGVASGASVPDGIFKDADGICRGILEVKHNTDTPAEAVRQGASEGTNVAMSHLARGVHVDDVLVPVVGSNGYLMQFGAVIMLKPSFPVFFMISHVLDLTRDADLLDAAKLLCCIKILVSQPLSNRRTDEAAAVLTPSSGIVRTMTLSSAAYHCKKLSDFFAITGNVQSSLFHYFKVMARLHKSIQCRKFIVFPICVRECNDSQDESLIVFPKLDKSYRIGLPEDEMHRAAFFVQLENAMKLVHDAGVAHIDLYLSNVMWRVNGNAVEVKIIDWDAAHFLDEDLSSEVQERIHGRRTDVMSTAMAQHEIEFRSWQGSVQWLDISLMRVWDKYRDEASLRVGDKALLDKACRVAQFRYIKDHGRR